MSGTLVTRIAWRRLQKDFCEACRRTTSGRKDFESMKLPSMSPWGLRNFSITANLAGKHKSTAHQSASKSFRPEGVDPEETSILLFPGQGAQFVGMGREVVDDVPSTRNLFDSASNILGYDLLELCLRGPLDKLDQTQHCQPAVVVSSLAAVEKLRHQNEDAINSCIGAAGFSVGEISALIFSGAVSFEDGIRLVKVRAEAMQRASEEQRSLMASCFTNHSTRLDLAFDTAKEWCMQKFMIHHPVCQTANHLYSDCKVIAGHAEAIEFIQEHKAKFNIRRLKLLPVSGAFHTPLMQPARREFSKMLDNIQINQPKVPVYSNVNKTYYKNTDEIREILPKQITASVMWEQLMHVIYARNFDEGYPVTYEVGPGSQLGSILYMTARKAHANYFSISI